MNDRTLVNVKLDKSAIEQLDQYAKKLKISRQQLMENLIDTGLEDMKILNASGMLMFGTAVRDLAAKLRSEKTEQPGQPIQES
jgi:hypothetical protein